MTNQRSSWKPVEGLYASQYMLVMVVSMALSIAVTRLYLELTGYPQIGNDVFHIAHALWGGLLQSIAAILLLVYLNRWIFYFSAMLAGGGLGLFIDEIGKFITQANDYFFPLAAPIIYISVILCVLLYLYIQREDRHDTRGEMYLVLDEMKSFLDGRIHPQQYDAMHIRLRQLSEQTERDDIASIAQGLLQALPENSADIPVPDENAIDKFINTLKRLEAKYFNRSNMRRMLMAYFLVVGAVTTVEIIVLAGLILDPQFLQDFVLTGILVDNPLVTSAYSLQWYLGLMIISIVIGILYLIAFITFKRRRENIAIRAAIIGLVLSLTIGSTMSFYFNQFAAMGTTILSFVLLLTILRYRDRFLQQENILKMLDHRPGHSRAL